MSVHVHVGQCGNQIGASYWHLAAAFTGGSGGDSDISGRERIRMRSRHLYHPATRAARCILVDSEPKVVRSICSDDTLLPAHAHVEQSGRGNNWAMGFYNTHRVRQKSPCTLDGDRRGLVELVMESLRQEVEATDSYQGSVLMHSLGGGTGSGLGCRVLQHMRDTYPRSYIVTASMAPSWSSGHSPLQNYNAVLTLRCLREFADAVVYKDNDELLRTAAHWKVLHAASSSSRADNVSRVSLADMNNVAAADLAGLLFPMASTSAGTTISQPFDFGKLLHDACPIPSAKMLDVRSAVWRDRVVPVDRRETQARKCVAGDSPSPLSHAPVIAESASLAMKHERVADYDASLETLEKLARQATQTFPRSSNSSQHSTLASTLTIRGFSPPAREAERFSKALGGVTDAAFPAASWRPSSGLTSSSTQVSYSSAGAFPGLRAQASATICVNNGHFLPSVTHFLERGQRQLQARAYVHWYTQHGLEEDEFKGAFDTCGALVNEYETLLR